jgi:hypothetical protein
MLKHISFVATVILFSVCVFAQAAGPAPHQHDDAPTVDGALHPELIPNSTAYRLFFIVTGADPNSGLKAHQKARLAALKLDLLDSEVLTTVLADFRVKYDDLIKRYNATAEAAALTHDVPDSEAFLAQREDLVETTRKTLKLSLTSVGLTKLDEHVQQEKQGIKIFGPRAK